MTRGRHVVLFFPFFFLPETWNGMDEHLRLLSAHLDRDRFDLVVAEHPDDGPQTRLLAERAAIRAVSVPSRNAPAGLRLRRLHRQLRELRVDLLHMHSPVTGGQVIPALAARAARVRATLSTYHQIQPTRLSGHRRVINRLVHDALVDRTIAVSEDVKRTLTEMAGLSGANVVVVTNGIDIDGDDHSPVATLARRDSEVIIGAFSRLSPEKGVPGVLNAMSMLVTRHPQARLVIVGDGPQRSELQDLAARLGIGDRVEFLGFRSDARSLMTQIDIFVHAPVYEGFGLVMLEAMAAGRPVVVAGSRGGPREVVIDGETGLVVAPGDTRALAEALAHLITDPDLRQRLGAAGRSRCAAHYSAQTMTARTLALYQAALR
jgi:glycosyltransferase involved in cell wall biosynthesis